jgi:restriction endonuclease Mrr
VIPDSRTLRITMLEILRDYPGGLNNRDIDALVASKLNLTDEDLKKIRTGNRTEFSYRMSWERTHAKSKGEIIRVGASVWKLV